MKDFSPQLQQELIDLLAEGELTAQERDQLFQQLDRSEGGWKRCALSLLESSALDQNLSSILNDVSAPNSTITKHSRSVENSKLQHRSALMTLAAILLVFVGFSGGHYMATDSATEANEDLPHFVAKVSHPMWQQLLDEDPRVTSQFDWSATGILDGRVIAFVGTADEERSTIYPIIESPHLAKQLSTIETPSLTSEAIQDLAQRGWKVSRQKQLVAIEQSDGTRMTLPIGMLNYRFIGRETF